MEIHHAPFVLVAQARSGSTMLRRALDAHDRICCHGELFMKKKVHGHSIHMPDLHWSEKPSALVKRREGDFENFIQSLVFPPFSYLSSIGFKILDQQFFFASNQERLTNLIATHSQMILIFLYRENALERYVSRLIRRGWLDPSGPQAVSVDDFKAFECESVSRMAQIYRLFPDHRKIVLSYESLAERVEPTISFLYGILGAELAPVIIEERKSQPRELSRLIENYQELLSLDLPAFDFDADDNPSEALAALDHRSPEECAHAAYLLGRGFLD